MKQHLNIVLASAAFALTMAIAAPALAQEMTVTSVAIPSICPMDIGFLKMDNDNDPAKVTMLQSFLKDNQGLDVDVNGTFDQKTQDAVVAFQDKYMADIMGPWQATRASGIVNITTVKKINQLACNVPLALNESDQDTLAAYNADPNNSSVATDAGATVGTAGMTFEPSTGTPGLADSDNTAAAVDAMDAPDSPHVSAWHRFMSFVYHMFR